MRYSVLLLILLPHLLLGQSEVPLTLRSQFNGPYGYTIIGNTHNEFDNWQSPSPPCEMLTQSSATLNLNANQNVIAAYLYWSGIGDGSANPIVTLNGINYTADQTFVGYPSSFEEFSFFGSFKDITNQIQLSGNGNYLFSNFDLNPIIGLYCSNAVYFSGWYIVVVYEEVGLDNKQLNIYDGYNVVYEYFQGGTTNFSIENLNVVETINAQLSYVAWNGSSNLFSNESITINGNPLSNVLNPIDNPFNGTNNFNGSSSLWNMDIDNFEISNFINVSDTNASITLNSEYFRFLQTMVTSIRSELPDATVEIDILGSQDICNNRDLTVNYTISNTNSNAILPTNVPVSIYADNLLLQTIFTNESVPINGSLSITQYVSIPITVPDTFTLKVVVDNNATNQSTVAESNENNNEAIQIVTLLGNTITPTFNIANTFCQGGSVPALPLSSTNGISGTWSPSTISNQNSGAYVFTPNADQCALPFTLNVAISPSINPTFTIPNAFCQGETVPALPLSSTNGISGTWSPNTISNQNSAAYIFTPSAGQCAASFTLNVAITTGEVPVFSLATSYCQNAAVATLPLVSDNGITGTWSPNVISNQTSDSYLFTPAAGQCASPFTLNVTISPEGVPVFSLATAYCQNAAVPLLPLVSDNGITGTWSPNVISNQTSGSYLFTPAAGQCGSPFTLNVTTNPAQVPVFSLATAYCQNAAVPLLPLVSDNGITGTWSPNVISNQTNGSYLFTPATGQCASPFTLNVTVNLAQVPVFSLATVYCRNAAVPALPLVSDNGIAGTWLPNDISNQFSGSYLFTPATGQCASPFTLNVTVSPAGLIEENILICETTTGFDSVLLITSLSSQIYTFQWFLESQVLSDSGPTLSVNGPGFYQAVATSVSTGCTSFFDFNVVATPLATVQINTSSDFSAQPFVEVSATGGSGSFLYSFNGAPFQSSSIFYPLDEYQVAVRVIDAQGCYSQDFVVDLLYYLRFFTPNGDGFNDTWGIGTQKNMTIEVFDRYGKLLHLMKNNEAWDGTYNGRPVPSTDYWFIIYYDQKSFRSHFSLKR